MRSITGFFKSVDELSDKFNICFINGLWIIMPVQGSKVNNSITLTNKRLKLVLIIKILIKEWDNGDFVFIQGKIIAKMCADKSGLSCYSYLDHN